MQLRSTEGTVTQLNIHDTKVDFKDETYDIVIHDGDISQSGHISTNNLVAKPEHVDTLVERFANRKGNVDKYDGFTGFMLIKSENKFSVLTGWKSTEDFNAWVNSEAFQNSHVKKEERVKEQGSDFLEEMPIRENYSVEV
ncbi:MAG TPA: antibiotic biosynthesis monooxygenase [Aliicoccus persicus]|uniref:Signal transduction protein TRAP n=1 Tax=Aliicoccus persicus TaxID=930138 RepID=A0A921DXC5_9STAP|nr:antibiotic biosynthesis monooxygenase [Aliicoccus persicus]